MWALGCVAKAMVAMITLSFIAFTVELPMVLVTAMFIAPAAAAAAFTGIRAVCGSRGSPSLCTGEGASPAK